MIVPRPTRLDRAPGEAATHAMFQRAHRLIVRLLVMYGGFASVIGLMLSVPAWPFPAPARLGALARACSASGFGAAMLEACLLAATALAGTLVVTAARQRPSFAVPPTDAGEPRGVRGAGFAARSGQAVVIPCGATLAGLAAWLAWPSGGVAPNAGDADLLAACAFGFAFASLVAERVLNAVIGPQLVEAPGLRRVVLLSTVLLALAGCIEIGSGAGLGWTMWATEAAIAVPLLIEAELVLRAAARMFLPAPAPDRASAVTESILAALLTGGPRMPGVLLRTHLGLDFARNRALGYLIAAAAPAALLTLLLCWGLSGLKLIDQDRRGVYERLGAPVAVLGPGVHVLLPWPLGRLRPVELGVIHTIAAGSDAVPEAGDPIAADAIPPETASRLWTTEHATEVNYLVASEAGGAQGFQVVSTEILVLYRIGLSEQDARDSVYGSADPDLAVRDAAARLATRYFGRRTLGDVMGDQPQTLSDALRRALAADVAHAHAGVEILAVVIEEIHPPAAAAAAYHMVQAAQITALASIADETGRATRMVAVAQQESHAMVDAAQATAVETIGTARAAAYRFAADRLADTANPGAFRLERRLQDLGAALAQVPLTLVDYRLTAGAGPTLDLRTEQNAAAPDITALSLTAPGINGPGAQPGTPNEGAETAGRFSYMPSGGTADTAPPTPDAAPDVAQALPPPARSP